MSQEPLKINIGNSHLRALKHSTFNTVFICRMYISRYCNCVSFSFVQRNKRKFFNTVKRNERKDFNPCYRSSKNIVLKTAKTSKLTGNCVRMWTYVSSFLNLSKNTLSKLLRIMKSIISFLHTEIISTSSACSLNETNAFLKFII